MFPALLNVFNHRTNVELKNRLVCFDIKQLGKQLKKLGMLIVQDQVSNRVTVTGRKEIHPLLHGRISFAPKRRTDRSLFRGDLEAIS